LLQQHYLSYLNIPLKNETQRVLVQADRDQARHLNLLFLYLVRSYLEEAPASHSQWQQVVLSGVYD